MKPILKWPYERLIKELLLLQDHLADPSCPCQTDREMCVRKHLLTIEAYSEETLSIETNEEYQAKLRELTQEGKALREAEEASLRGEKASFPVDAMEWTRKWRKEFEAYSLAEVKDE